jgi:hypothetical protein
MVYKIDYVDGDVLTWSATESGVTCEVDESYTPTIYVSVHGDGDFSTARAALRDHPAVVRLTVVDERVSFHHDPEHVLRVDVVNLKAVNSVARMVSKWGSPGEYRCYNVDFSREFRYCLEEGIDPFPNHEMYGTPPSTVDSTTVSSEARLFNRSHARTAKRGGRSSPSRRKVSTPTHRRTGTTRKTDANSVPTFGATSTRFSGASVAVSKSLSGKN